MDKNKKEKMRNWLETGVHETNKERLIREKNSIENLERKENLIKHGKNMTDMEIINETNVKKIINEFLDRLAEAEQLKTTSKDRKFIRLLKKLKKLIEITLDEILDEQNSLRIDNYELTKKIEFINLEFERIKNYKDTKIKETNKDRAAREKRIDDAAPYRQRVDYALPNEPPLTPQDKDFHS